MLKIDEIKSNKKLHEICKQYRVKSMAIFGSMAKGDNNEKSDLDILIEFSGKKNLFKIIQLSHQISELLRIDVDLVTKEALSEYIRDKVDKEKEIIYEETR